MDTPEAPPLAVSTPVAAVLLSMARATLARHAEQGLDVGGGRVVRPLRMGRAWTWPTAPILDALGVSNDTAARAATVAFAEGQVRAGYAAGQGAAA